MKDFWVRYHHLALPEMFLLNPVISRKCFVCLSNTSWNDCDANRKEAECSTSTHCFRSSSNISRKESYAKRESYDFSKEARSMNIVFFVT